MQISTVTTQTMSNKEIASLTGKQLSHVNRDIAKMMAEILDLDDPKMDDLDFKGFSCSLDNRGYVSDITLDYDLTTCLLTGYDAKARMAVVKRWQELENAAPKELSRLEILTMAIESEQKVIALEAKIEEDSSKVSFVEDYVEHGNSKCFRDVAAMIGVKQGYFTKVLMNKSIVYKKGGEYKAYSEFAKYFDVKTGINNYVDDSGQTQQKEYTQLRINSAGIVYFAKRFGNPELKEAAEPPIVHPRHKSALSVVGGVA